jgi:hypothetical protein
MDSIFLIALIVAVLYLLAKYVEARFVEKESKPLKFLLRDSILVYLIVLFSNFIFSQVSHSENITSPPLVFTDVPNF